MKNQIENQIRKVQEEMETLQAMIQVQEGLEKADAVLNILDSVKHNDTVYTMLDWIVEGFETQSFKDNIDVDEVIEQAIENYLVNIPLATKKQKVTEDKKYITDFVNNTTDKNRDYNLSQIVNVMYDNVEYEALSDLMFEYFEKIDKIIKIFQ